jgi:hypothetical protein
MAKVLSWQLQKSKNMTYISVIYIRKQHFRIFIRIRYSKILYKIQVKFTIAYPDENPKMLFSNVNHWYFSITIALYLYNILMYLLGMHRISRHNILSMILLCWFRISYPVCQIPDSVIIYLTEYWSNNKRGILGICTWATFTGTLLHALYRYSLQWRRYT